MDTKGSHAMPDHPSSANPAYTNSIVEQSMEDLSKSIDSLDCVVFALEARLSLVYLQPQVTDKTLAVGPISVRGCPLTNNILWKKDRIQSLSDTIAHLLANLEI